MNQYKDSRWQKKQKPTFWTHERLKELAILFDTKSSRELERHFKKRYEDILQAYEYWQSHKRFKISSVKKRKVRVTKYRPGYAEGYHPEHNELTYI